MRPPTSARFLAVAVLLCGAMNAPVAGWAHWEGFEAADPSTPAALLRFESAAAGYVEAKVVSGSWLERFDAVGQPAEAGQSPATSTGERDAVGAGEHSGHTGVEPPAPTPLPE